MIEVPYGPEPSLGSPPIPTQAVRPGPLVLGSLILEPASNPMQCLMVYPENMAVSCAVAGGTVLPARVLRTARIADRGQRLFTEKRRRFTLRGSIPRPSHRPVLFYPLIGLHDHNYNTGYGFWPAENRRKFKNLQLIHIFYFYTWTKNKK